MTITITSGQYRATSFTGKVWDITRIPSGVLIETKVGSYTKIQKRLSDLNAR